MGALWGKKGLSLAAVLLLGALLVAACGGTGGGEGDEAPYVIGVAVDETGGSASLGAPEMETARMLEERINESGGINGRELRIVKEDTESDNTTAVLALQRLIEEEDVLAVVGGTTSGESLAMVEVAQEQETPFISVAASRQIVEPVKEWVFKTPQTDTQALQVILEEYLLPQDYRDIGWMSVSGGYGDSGWTEFQELVDEYDLTVTANERFEYEDTDMTAQLVNVDEANPDAIIVWSIPPSASIATRNYGDLGIEAPLVQSHGVANADYIEQSGGAVEGVVLPVGKLPVVEQLPDEDPQKETLLQYASNYEDYSGEVPNTFGGHAWDGIMLLVEALENGATTRADIRDYLESDIEEFVGISGIFNFSPEDHLGLDARAMVMAEIRDGTFQLYETD